MQQPGERAGVFKAMTWVIVLRSDPLPKQEANVDRARNRSLVFPRDMERPIEMENLAPMKDDLPWNRCC
jgi:hypothetical protein